MNRSALHRRTPLAAMSERRRAISGLRQAFVKRMLAERPLCEAKMLDCQVKSIHVHEIKTRARGGSILASSNVLALCWSCHQRIHANPALAAELGMLRNSWQGA